VRLLYAADHRIDAYLVHALREAGHVVEPTAETADALVMAGGGDYQAIVLDWTKPPAACVRKFAKAAERALVVVIAASSDAASRAAVLAAGADACFARPFAYRELEARLEALERLTARLHPVAAGAEMAPARQAVRVDGQTISLSPREFRIMADLVAHAGEIVSLERLHRQGWGDEAEPRPDLVQACLRRLRHKLLAAGTSSEVRRVGGHGYVFEPHPDHNGQDENRLTGAITPG
jgi:DNA-binding response OmpR family regulator